MLIIVVFMIVWVVRLRVLQSEELASNHRLLIYRTKNIWFPDVESYIADPTYYLVDEIALPANYFQTIHSPYIISTQVLSNAVYRDQFHDSALSVSEPFEFVLSLEVTPLTVSYISGPSVAPR